MRDSLVDIGLLTVLVSFFLVVAVAICREPGHPKGRIYSAWRMLMARLRRSAHRDERWLTLRELQARRLRGDR
jgi:hypothetical protein